MEQFTFLSVKYILIALKNGGNSLIIAVKRVGQGVSELRINDGAGYRVHFIQRGNSLIILLAEDDKKTQNKDIQTALELTQNL